MDTSVIGLSLLLFGLLVASIGALLLIAPRVPFLGRLPGDITFERDGFSIFFPLATSIVLSIALTIAINVIIRLVR